MRFWHLIFGMVFFYLAAQVSIGVPGSVAGYGRWLSLFGVAGIGGWILLTSDHYRPFPEEARGLGATIAALVATLFATAVAGFAVTISVLKGVLLCTQLFVLIYAANRLLSLRDWYRVIQWSFLLFAGVLTVVFVAVVTGVTLIPTRWPVFMQGRIAVIGNPNSVGMVALVGGVMALWAQHWPMFAASWKRAIPLFTVAVAVLVLVWTASRTSIVAFAIGGLIWAVAARKLKWGVGLGILAGGAMLTGIVDTRSFGFASVLLERLQEGTLTASRDNVWEASLRNWREYPWFGHGYGVTEGGYQAEGFLDAVGSVRDGSGYFGVLESIGIVGAAMLGVLYVVVAQNMTRLLWHATPGGVEQPAKILALTGVSLFFSLAVHASGEPWLLGPGSFAHLMFWFALGLCIAGMRTPSGNRLHSRRSRSLHPASTHGGREA